MKIKAISIWQPWASLIAVVAKKFETRSWKTNYRGPLLICAAKKPFNSFHFSATFVDAAQKALPYPIGGYQIPYGKAVAIADLTACLTTFNYQTDWIGLEATFGDFSLGRYAWKLENVRAIKPFPVKGRQGLFDVEVPERLI
ncbi:MAG: ASCH domain-containing protein [Methanoregula sp.]